MKDPFALSRFVDAQQSAYAAALAELNAGTKRSHWMWFVFPQLTGLGSSTMAQRYAISGLEEARAYLRHPLLGARLLACTAAVNQVAGRTAHQIFGSPDDLKFHSSLTLFQAADRGAPEFTQALQRCFGGKPDARTLILLGRT